MMSFKRGHREAVEEERKAILARATGDQTAPLMTSSTYSLTTWVCWWMANEITWSAPFLGYNEIIPSYGWSGNWQYVREISFCLLTTPPLLSQASALNSETHSGPESLKWFSWISFWIGFKLIFTNWKPTSVLEITPINRDWMVNGFDLNLKYNDLSYTQKQHHNLWHLYFIEMFHRRIHIPRL